MMIRYLLVRRSVRLGRFLQGTVTRGTRRLLMLFQRCSPVLDAIGLPLVIVGHLRWLLFVLFRYDVNVHVGEAFVVQEHFDVIGEKLQGFETFLIVGEETRARVGRSR